MDPTQLLPQLTRLLADQRFAALATTGCTTPYANLVAFAVSDDLCRIWFATPRGARKHANLRTDPRVALLADNRSNRAEDIAEAIAATATGRATPLTGEDRQAAQGAYLRKHPALAEFLAQPNCVLFEIRVDRYIVVRSFQDVVEIHPARQGLQ